MRHLKTVYYSLRLIALTLVGFLLFNSAGKIDGWLFPAAAPMVLVEAHQDGLHVVYSGTTERLRPGCSPSELRFYRGKRFGQNSEISDWSWGPPIIRPNSEFAFAGWRVQAASVEEFVDDTFSDVRHRCRIFYTMNEQDEAIGGITLPWVTITPFWN